MKTRSNENFRTHAEWFRTVLEEDITEDVILCRTSALELLGMFNGFIVEEIIDVYALEKGKYENVEYHIVESLDHVQTTTVHGVLCATFEYTVNDMLKDYPQTDLWALTEALCNYYAQHNDSFDGLKISPENAKAFEAIKPDAITYFDGGD